MLYLNLVWHMHQPYYADDESGMIEMPWVYLHALKDYSEMLWYMRPYPQVKATFNLSPSLLVQLERYGDMHVNDRLLNLIRSKSDTLDSEAYALFIRYMHASHFEHQIKPLPRYVALLQQNETLTPNEIDEIAVLFLLSWCGNYLRSKSSYIQTLLAQKEGFTASQKMQLLQELAAFTTTIIDEYKQMHQSGQIALSFNPMYHPIMPLLVDMKSAQRSNEHVKMPEQTCSFEADATIQLQRGMQTFKRLFDCMPDGIWPSEGSVSRASLQLYKEANIAVAATDEEILLASTAGERANLLYKPYYFLDDTGPMLLFRDKPLSDKIGFHYASMHPTDSANDFIHSLQSIDQLYEGNKLVSVILDGENAWEFYPNNAQDFFHTLYTRLSETPFITMVNYKTLHKLDIETPVLDHIHPGSWISRDFSTWIGQDEKNRAWELLCTCKRDVQNVLPTLNETQQSALQRELLIAEGSDWFWWYGEGHHSDYADLFDALFRKHLINCYVIMNRTVPAEMMHSIINTHAIKKSHFPTAMISPLINGKRDNFFEWLGAGVIENSVQTNVMDTSSKLMFKQLHYGFDKKRLYLSIDGNFHDLPPQTTLQIEINDSAQFSIALQGDCKAHQNADLLFCFDTLIECAISIESLLEEDAETLSLTLALYEDNQLLEAFMPNDRAHLIIYSPDERDWFV